MLRPGVVSVAVCCPQRSEPAWAERSKRITGVGCQDQASRLFIERAYQSMRLPHAERGIDRLAIDMLQQAQSSCLAATLLERVACALIALLIRTMRSSNIVVINNTWSYLRSTSYPSWLLALKSRGFACTNRISQHIIQIDSTETAI